MPNNSSYAFHMESDLSETTPILGRRQRRIPVTDNREGSTKKKSGAGTFFYKFLKRQVIPVRVVMVLVCFLGFVNVYAMRVNLSVGLVVMVNNTASVQGGVSAMSTVTCPELLRGKDHESEQMSHQNDGKFFWDEKAKSRILGSFFYGYVLTQIPGGVLAEIFGAKWFFGIGVLVTSVFTILTPLAAEMGEGYLFAARFIEGLAEGVTFPAANVLIGRWVPTMERSRMSTIIFSGSSVGTVLAMAISGLLAETNFLGGWPSIFYFFGVAGCLWFGFWSLLVSEHPSDHPAITESELQHIRQHHSDSNVGSRPWFEIFTSYRVWALAITHFGQNWGFYTLLTEMPTYLATVLHYDIKENGLISSSPYILQALCAYVGSIIADWLRRRNILSITTIRKIMNSIAFYVPAACFLVAAFTGCRPYIMITLFCVCAAFNGFFHSGFNVTHVDMSPTYAGTLMGITNTVSNTAGFLAPMTVGNILESNELNKLEGWSKIFTIAAGMYFTTGTIYNIFCTAELQPWDPSARRTASDSIAQPEDDESATTVIKVTSRS